MMSVSRETEYHTYHLTIAEAKALREALEGSGSFAHRAVSFAEQQEFVDGIWRGIAARCHCDLERLVDRLVLTVAPILMGGLRAVEQILELTEAAGGPPSFPALVTPGSAWLGKDLVLWGELL